MVQQHSLTLLSTAYLSQIKQLKTDVHVRHCYPVVKYRKILQHLKVTFHRLPSLYRNVITDPYGVVRGGCFLRVPDDRLFFHALDDHFEKGRIG